MASKDDILVLPNKILRQPSKRVSVFDDNLHKLVTKMIKVGLDWEASREYEVCVGLAAVQIGILNKVVILRSEETENKEYEVLINPKIIKTYGEPTLDFEGCLSVKDIYGLVPRYTKVKIQAQNEIGEVVRQTADGFRARLLQHEIDHTKGTLFIDHIKDIEEAFHIINGEGKIERIDYGDVVSSGIFR